MGNGYLLENYLCRIRIFFEKSQRMQLAKNKGSIYLTAYTLRNKKAVDERFKFIKDSGMNAVVIDFKDDNGNLTYSSKLSCQ